MSKHGIVGRVTRLARTDVDALIDLAENPQQMLDRLVRDYTTNIAEAEQAIARLIANLRIAEDDQQADATAAVQWSAQAEATSQKADELRATGEAVEADRFDNLARVALERQMIAENDVETVRHTITVQNESIDMLKDGLDQMRVKLSDLKRKRDGAMARSRGAQPRTRLQDTVKSVDIMDPSSEVDLFEEKVRQEEARMRGAGELQASPLDAHFASVDDLGNKAEADERLKALKAGRAMASAKAKAQAQAQDQPLR
jgi:phage shock protein A